MINIPIKKSLLLNKYKNIPHKWDYWTTDEIIKKIELNLNNIINKLQLTVSVTPSEFLQLTKGYKHRYYTDCINPQGKKYFFCALMKNDELSKKSFYKEIAFASFVINNDFLIKKYLPPYIQSSKLDLTPWILSEYISTPVLESKVNMEQLRDISFIKDLSLIAELLFNITFNFINIRNFNLRLEYFDVKKEISELIMNKLTDLKNRNQIDSISFNKAIKFINSNLNLLLEENKYFTHGDFHIGNISAEKVNNSIRLKIIDWETYHMNNYAYDISYFFSKLSKEKIFRKLILSNYMKLIPTDKINRFKTLFRLNIIYLAVKDGLTATFLELSNKEVIERQEWFKNLFMKSLVSFDEIMNI